MTEPISVLFVCLGNICRSPLAAAVFRQVATEEGVESRFRIDSAGTSGYHNGEPPDSRTTATAARRGVEVTGTSRQITGTDVEEFDYLVAMDADNLRAVERLVERVGVGDDGPAVHLFREFDPEAAGDLEVPDPYYGGPRGFDDVHDLVERSAHGLLEHLRERHDL
ncbi:MAG: low molecular weight protein-tyrosine-phosphatase [Longimicrobiales bacterium]|nr:low molecular weight protein-tyrosine-phosphatase [Longimicrobiales bacterium]